MPKLPEGFHTVTPRVFVDDPAALVRFLQEAFQATATYEADRPTNVLIGDSMLIVSGVEVRAHHTGVFYLYVDDVSVTHERALKAGAVSLEEPRDTPYGDRRSMVRDPAGNIWQIAAMG